MHIHILGIAGTMTAPLAAELKKQGHKVTGTDQAKIYPPVSTILSKAKIKINQKLSSTPDFVIIGSSYKAFSNLVSEFKDIKRQKIPYLSATRYVSKNVSQKNTILIAGSYGKTTITSLVAWILKKANFDPSYMFGGESLNQIPSLEINHSPWSVIEADESINGLDTKAKFLYYPAKYVLLTSADWEHKDSYSSSSDNLQAFKNLAQRIDKKGFLLYNHDSQSASQVAASAKSQVYSYGNHPDSNFKITQINPKSTKTKLTISTPKGNYIVSTKLFGQHNYHNILAAFALAWLLGINPSQISKAITSYKGIKRRLQVVFQSDDHIFIDDFAQAAFRVRSAINAVAQKFPQHQIYVIFEPHASFLAHLSEVSNFTSVFDPAAKIILTKIPYKPNIPANHRATAKDYKNIIGSKLDYLPLSDQVFDFFTKTPLPSKSVLIHFSSGGLDGLKNFRRIINYYKKYSSSN